MAHKELNSKVLKLKPTLCQESSCSLCCFPGVHSSEFPLIKLKIPVSTSMALLQGIWMGRRTSLKLHLEQFHADTGRQGRGRCMAHQHWKLPSEICLIILLLGVLHTSWTAREELWKVRQKKEQANFLQRQERKT